MNSIPCPLYKNAELYPQLSALIGDGIKLTYGQLDYLVSLIASYLKKQGIKSRDRVVVISPNSVEEIILFLSLWRIKAICCPLNHLLPLRTLKEQIKTIEGKVILTPLKEILETKKIKTPKIDFEEIFTQKADERYKLKSQTIPLQQPATIIFTSGSSNAPKAVLHSYANHYYSALGSNEHIAVQKGDCWLLALPLYHVGGLSIIFRILLGKGCIFVPSYQEILSKALKKYHVTHVSLVSTQLFRILKNKISLEGFKNLKAILLGGSAFPENLLRQAIACKLPIYTSYGLTEMSSQVATTQKIKSEKELSQSHLLKYRQFKISKEGEILVKGKTLCQGYVQGRKTDFPVDKRGWFPTGDLGEVNKEGALTVTGRKDNLFISGGENIQPEEVEKYICQIKDVEEAIVVPIANEEFGTRPIAFVKTKNKAKLNKYKILRHLHQYLPKFKIPEEIFEWPHELEDTGVKIGRKKAFEIAQNKSPTLSILN